MSRTNKILPKNSELDANETDHKAINFDTVEGNDKAISSKTMAESPQPAMHMRSASLKSMKPILKQQAILNSIKQSMLKDSSRISAIIAPILERQKLLSSFAAPLKGISDEVAFKSLELISPAIHTYYQNIANSLAISIKPLMDNYRISLDDSIRNLLSSYNYNITQQMQLPLQRLLSSIDFLPAYSIFEQFKEFDFSKYRSQLNGIIIEETFDAKWFPHALCLDDRDMIAKFWKILETTKKNKTRIKQIDQLVINHYNKSRIECMKRTWRYKNVANYTYRIMHEAVQAYHRKEYAITVVMLSTLWEGIIYNKANDSRSKSGKRTKANFSKLISQTDFGALCAAFFDTYIMYDCRSINDVIDDVPGRNSSAHSWYSKYPSKKAGLNAILFTDFLMNLECAE